jgi:hypothetical protein
MDLTTMTERALVQAWRLAGAFVQEVTYVQPAGFNPATGLTRATEASVEVLAILVTLRPREWDLVVTQPGDERVLLRAKDLGSIVPVAGDYLVGADGVHRDVRSAHKAAGGVLWLLYCTPERSEDWGDLTTSTVFEDRGDLSAVTTSEDWGVLV